MGDFLLGWIPQGVWDALATWQIALSLWPWFLAAGVVGMVLGAWLGPGKTAMLLTGGLALFVILRKDKAVEPDWESGLPDRLKPVPAKMPRRTARR